MERHCIGQYKRAIVRRPLVDIHVIATMPTKMQMTLGLVLLGDYIWQVIQLIRVFMSVHLSLNVSYPCSVYTCLTNSRSTHARYTVLLEIEGGIKHLQPTCSIGEKDWYIWHAYEFWSKFANSNYNGNSLSRLNSHDMIEGYNGYIRSNAYIHQQWQSYIFWRQGILDVYLRRKFI